MDLYHQYSTKMNSAYHYYSADYTRRRLLLADVAF